ncbi:MAG: IPT/TIG domain-containing protein [Bradymonadaceae bacterium]
MASAIFNPIRPVFIALIAIGLLAACSTDPNPQRPDAGVEPDGSIDADPDAEAGLQLSSVSPRQGPVVGGTQVTLGGSGFEQGLTVLFGDEPATDVQIQSSRSIIARTPAAGAPGTVDVRVQNPDGGEAVITNAFTYIDSDQAVVEFCQLQAQSPVNVEAGQATPELFAIVFAPGITQGEGQGAGIEGELGYGTSAQSRTDFNFVPMAYNLDKDGLEPGDLANDEYGASLTINEPGEYQYVARFRLQSLPDMWVYCGLDGSEGGAGAIVPGVIEVTGEFVPTLEYCRTETTSALTIPDTATSALTGLVYAAGITPGEGRGEGIDAEIVWGDPSVDPTTWTESISATYREDADGLVEGDRSNDRYEAMITPDALGTYAFAFRFRLGEDGDWLYCSTEGTDQGDGVPSTDDLGTMEVVDEIILRPDACHVQYPHVLADAVINEPVTIYGRVTTTGDPTVSAMLLVGPEDASPLTDHAAFATVDATINADVSGQSYDEYEAEFTPTAAGTHSLYYAFSLDGGSNWSYCDLLARPGTFDVEMGQGAALVVHDESPDHIHYCRVWQDVMTLTTNDDPPIITVEVYEAGITDDGSGDNADDLEVQAGFGPRGANPALDGAYHWPSEVLAFKAVHPTNQSNYEYEGIVYPADDKPVTGTHDVTVRIRKTTDTSWVYCDTDHTTMDFHVDRTTRLNLSSP